MHDDPVFSVSSNHKSVIKSASRSATNDILRAVAKRPTTRVKRADVIPFSPPGGQQGPSADATYLTANFGRLDDFVILWRAAAAAAAGRPSASLETDILRHGLRAPKGAL